MPRGYLRVDGFGKLPVWREYLQPRGSQPTTRALIEWLRRGKEALVLTTEEQGGDVEPRFTAELRLLVAPPGSKELLAGVVRPSRDEAGRSFPFTVFTHIPRKIYGKRFFLIPMALAPVWEGLEDVWDSLASEATREAYDEAIGSAEVPEPVSLAEARAAYEARQGESAGALFGDGTGASWNSLSRNLPEAVARLGKSGSAGVSLQFPVSPDLEESCFNAGVWVDLINRQFRLRRYEPTVLLDGRRSAADRQLILRFGELTPAEYLQLLGHEGDTLRPAHGGEGDATEERPSTYAALLGQRLA